MKTNYPVYKQGDLNELEQNLSHKNKQILKDFLKKCSITAGESKLNKIRNILLQIHDVTEKDLYKQNKETIDSFLVVLNKSNRSVWTKNEIKVYLKQFVKWYYKDLEMIENVKADNKRDLNAQKITENNLVTEEDVEKMLRFAESYKNKAYLLLSFQTGARPQELLTLKWKDIKFEDKYADITLFSRKTMRSRTFPVVEKTKDALWEWKQHYSFPDVSPKDYVFVSRWRDKPMTSAGLNKALRRMSKLAGLNKDVWNYLIRHTRATRLYEELPQQIVEKLMGHKNMAGIYAHISNKKAREVMLNKIYHIEGLTKEDKEEIKKLKQDIEMLKGFNNIMVNFLVEDMSKKKTQEDIKKFVKEYRESIINN